MVQLFNLTVRSELNVKEVTDVPSWVIQLLHLIAIHSVCVVKGIRGPFCDNGS